MSGFPNYSGRTLTPSRPPFTAGNWYPMAAITNAAGGVGQNTIQLSKFNLPVSVTLSDLGAQVSTGLAANNCQLAIYASDPVTGLPTGNALASTGDISVASSGGISADITGPNVTLPAGFYWAACNHQGASSILAGSILPLSSYLQGSATMSNIVGATLGTTGYKRTVAQTYGTWPDLTGVSTTEVNAAGPFLFLKAA